MFSAEGRQGALESRTGSRWAEDGQRGQILRGFACQSQELGPSPGGTGEPARALRQGGSVVTPEVPPADQGGVVKGEIMKARSPVWGLILLIWLCFFKLAFILPNT